jgi:hypothetical protein
VQFHNRRVMCYTRKVQAGSDPGVNGDGERS